MAAVPATNEVRARFDPAIVPASHAARVGAVLRLEAHRMPVGAVCGLRAQSADVWFALE